VDEYLPLEYHRCPDVVNPVGDLIATLESALEIEEPLYMHLAETVTLESSFSHSTDGSILMSLISRDWGETLVKRDNAIKNVRVAFFNIII
jgi:hypothetical protein